MKHLKKFNEDNVWRNVSSQELEDDTELNNLNEPKPWDGKGIPPGYARSSNDAKLPFDRFEQFMIDCEKKLDTDFESATKELRQFKAAHPFITSESSYKDLWWNIVKKWHMKLKEQHLPL